MLGDIPFAGFINDRNGNKTIIIVGTSLMFIGSAIRAGTIAVGMFLAASIMLGFDVSFNCRGRLSLTKPAYSSQRPSFRVCSFLAFIWVSNKSQYAQAIS